MGGDEHVQKRMVLLARTLLSGTNSGQIAWSITDKETSFLFSGTNASVKIGRSARSRSGDDIFLALLNAGGFEVAKIEKVPPSDDPWAKDDEIAFNDLFDGLYSAARRSALNVDGVLDAIFADLSERRTEARTMPDDDSGFSDELPF